MIIYLEVTTQHFQGSYTHRLVVYDHYDLVSLIPLAKEKYSEVTHPCLNPQ